MEKTDQIENFKKQRQEKENVAQVGCNLQRILPQSVEIKLLNSRQNAQSFLKIQDKADNH